MKVFLLLFCTTVFGMSSNEMNSQNTGIKVTEDRTFTVEEVFGMIKAQTDYNFIYPTGIFNSTEKVRVPKGTIKLNDLLKLCFKGKGIHFQIDNEDTIYIESDTVSAPESVDQENKVSGRVLDGNGQALPGVTVLVENTTRGTATDFDGDFTINVNKGETLVFTYIGFKEQKVLISNQQELQIIMEESSIAIDEVLVIGYGKARKGDLTGSVGSINTETIQKNISPNVESIIGGQISGVNVTRQSGAPGAGASIQIRGFSTLSGSNEPLYVVDGVPFQPGLSDTNEGVNPLTFLNPSDISSVVVLKDASSTAIYGSRAANGVVLITTKQGTNDKDTFVLNVTSSFQIPTFKTKLLNRDQFLDVYEEAATNAGLPFEDLGGNTDWVKEALRVALMNNIDFGYNGTSNNHKTKYAASLAYTDQEGILMQSFYERYSGRLSIESQILDEFKVGSSINYIVSKRDPGVSFRQIAFQRPDMPKDYSVFNPDYTNYYLKGTRSKRLTESNIMFGSIYGELNLTDKLTAKTAFNISTIANDRYDFKTAMFEADSEAKRLDLDYQKNSFVWDNTLTYINNWNNTHFLTAVAGAAWNQDVEKIQSIQSAGFANEEFLFNLGSANRIIDFNSSENTTGLASYFARFNYNFKDKYYLNFTGRADKSSKFGPNNKWGYFPSGGVAWDISKEDFIKTEEINYLKLKSSIGVSGLASFPDFLYRTLYGSGSFYQGQNGYIPTQIPNEDIRWEKTSQFDLGLEFGLFNNTVTGSVGYYSKYTNGLLLPVPIPLEPGGGETQFRNVGEMSNKGIEIELGATFFKTQDFSWSANLNLTTQRNRIEKLEDGKIDDFGYTYLEEGKSLGSFLGYKTDGIFQSQAEIDQLNAGSSTGRYMFAETSPGDVKIVDINGDGRITAADDKTIVGNALPDFYGGINNTVSYKNFELIANFQYQVGNELSPDIVRSYSTAGSPSSITNYTTTSLDAWTPDNTNSGIPRNVLTSNTYNTFYLTDRNVEDASYIKLKNVRLTYRFNKSALLKGVDASMFVSATDLFTITGYSGEDPETFEASPVNRASVAFGTDSFAYPYSRTLSVGLNLKF